MSRDPEVFNRLEKVYGLVTSKLIDTLHTVENQFIRSLYALSVQEAKNLQVLSFILPNHANKRGEIAERGVASKDKKVWDICLLQGLAGIPECKNVLEEIALYRSLQLGYETRNPGFYLKHKYMLMADYLLTASLCYVEIFDKNKCEQKFYATRNRLIAGELANMTELDSRKFSQYLSPYEASYEMNQIKTLRLKEKKVGFTVTQPRSVLDFSANIKVTPVFLLTSFVEGFKDVALQHMVKIRFLKDNLQEREVITTLNGGILGTYYDADKVNEMMNTSSLQINQRGFITVPELGISKYDSTGTRSINVARIIHIEPVSEFDTSFINVDFSTIVSSFISYVRASNNIPDLTRMYVQLVGGGVEGKTLSMVQAEIISRVEQLNLAETTTFQRSLHRFMMENPYVFPGYDGKPKDNQGFFGHGSGSFNLGLGD